MQNRFQCWFLSTLAVWTVHVKKRALTRADFGVRHPKKFACTGADFGVQHPHESSPRSKVAQTLFVQTTLPLLDRARWNGSRCYRLFHHIKPATVFIWQCASKDVRQGHLHSGHSSGSRMLSGRWDLLDLQPAESYGDKSMSWSWHGIDRFQPALPR